MADLDLGPIKARIAAASPGPWIVQRVRECGDELWVDSFCRVETKEEGDADTALLAHARKDLPLLVAEVADLKAEVTALTDLLTDQHYYETDCSGCADNKRAAEKFLEGK